jgi:hypothetical protein
MSNVKARVFYAAIALAAIAAGVAPWALGLGRSGGVPGAPAVSSLSPAANAELATAAGISGWPDVQGHGVMLERVGTIATDGDPGETVPAQPALWLSCGGTRDDGTKWMVVGDGSEPCPGVSAYSYAPNTSPSNVRTATWWPAWAGGFSAPRGYYTVKARIPLKYAGALVEYDVRYCGQSQSSWQPIGTIDQAKSTGWTTVTKKLYVDLSEAVCQIREHNTGPRVADMTEDALEILAN